MHMKEELLAIADLMEELAEKMEYGEEDFNERLGKKPEVKVLEIKKGPMLEMGEEEMEGGEEMLGMGEDEMEEDEEGLMGPDLELKKRLMKMRG